MINKLNMLADFCHRIKCHLVFKNMRHCMKSCRIKSTIDIKIDLYTD